jgi:hypothetical protein
MHPAPPLFSANRTVHRATWADRLRLILDKILQILCSIWPLTADYEAWWNERLYGATLSLLDKSVGFS